MKTTKKRVIIAIGGGDLRKRSTLAIDNEIIRSSGKRHPRLLFIPTASSDDFAYWIGVQSYFGQLGCKTDVLFLVRERPRTAEIKRKIFAADIIYVGGGNTLKMMRVWRRIGVDRYLRCAYERGIVLCGISAGAICWFDHGHSDSMSYYKKKWKFIRVKGLGLLRGLHCPHYNSGTKGISRRKDFIQMVRKFGGFGVAIEDCCAIKFTDGQPKAIASKPGRAAWKVWKASDKIKKARI